MSDRQKNKEDWWPITPSTSSVQVQWCQNIPTKNVRAKKVGETRWRYLDEDIGIASNVADLVGIAMLKGERKSKLG